MRLIKRYWPLLLFFAIVAILAGSLAVWAIAFYDADADTDLGDESDIIRVPVDMPTSTPITPGAACTFTADGSEQPIYHAPLADPSQQRDTIPGGTPYPVSARDIGYVFITVEADRAGWVPLDQGTLNGDCDAVPVEDKAWADYPTVCYIESFTAMPIHAAPDLSDAGASLPPDSYPVVRRSAAAVALVWDGTPSPGWVSADDVRLRGACDDLPQE